MPLSSVVSWMRLGRSRHLVKVLILVPLAIIATIAATTGAGIVSLSQATRLGVNSLLVYWASIPTAVILLSLRNKLQLSRVILASSFLFVMFVRIGSALLNLFAETPLMEITVPYLVAVELEFAIMGFLMLFAFSLRESESHGSNQLRRSVIIGVTLSLVLIAYGMTTKLLFPLLNESILGILSIIFAAVAVITFLLTPFLASRQKRDGFSIDLGYLLTSSLLMAIASVYTFFAIATQSDYWIYGENIQTAAFFIFGLSIGVPFLRRCGFRRRTSYVVIIWLAVSTYIPLLATTIFESLGLNQVIEVSNLLAYAIIHAGTSALAIMMILLLFAYSRLKPAKTQYPLTMLFAVWAGVGVISVTTFVLPGAIYLGENVTPYIAGGILTLWLLRKLYQSLESDADESYQITTIQLFRDALVYFLAVVAAEVINLFINGVFNLGPNLIGNGFLLVCNFLVMLSFVFVVFRLSSVSQDVISFELYVISFLTLWIMPSTLKSFYPVWTYGWWLSEILLFIGLLIGPAILALLYIQAVRDVNESHTRAKLYADILMHDITNYNQMTLTTLELIASERADVTDLKRMVGDAKHAVSLAEQLISNVRLLSESDEWKSRPTASINLVSEVVRVLDAITHSPRNPDRVFRFASDISRAHVHGNELLYDAFLNILYVALDIPSNRNEFEIAILPLSNFDEKWWGIRTEISDISINSKGSEELNGRDLLSNIQRTLGFQVAKLIIEEMEGYLDIETEINERGRCVNVTVSLPAVEPADKL